MNEMLKREKICSLKNCLVFLICFLVIMITPISAVQVTTTGTHSVTSDFKNNVKDSKISPNMKFKSMKTLHNSFKSKINTQKKIYKKDSNKFVFSKQAAHASQLLPIMEESYQKNSNGIHMTQNVLKELEQKKIDTTKKIKKIKYDLDKFEVKSNNTERYNQLNKEYQEYQNLETSLQITNSETKRIKGILNKKQGHVRTCITALKQIQKSENVKNAVNTYNKNVDCLAVISNNMATEIQQKKEIILASNNTCNNNTNNTSNTTSPSNNETKLTTEFLRLGGIGGISLTGVACISSIVSIIAYGVTTTQASTALLTASSYAALFESFRWTLTSIDMAAMNTAFIESTVAENAAMTAVGIATNVGLVSTILVVSAVILVIATAAICIAYFGYESHWW